MEKPSRFCDKPYGTYTIADFVDDTKAAGSHVTGLPQGIDLEEAARIVAESEIDIKDPRSSYAIRGKQHTLFAGWYPKIITSVEDDHLFRITARMGEFQALIDLEVLPAMAEYIEAEMRKASRPQA